MLEIGKMLSAEAIIVGSIGQVGTKYVLSAKMLETETARTLNTADGIYKDLDELLDNIFDVAGELVATYIVQAVAETTPEPEPVEEPAPEKLGEELEAEPREPKEPSSVNIPAFATLAGGLASTGTGAYFLAVFLPLLFEYTNAKTAYEEASADTDDIPALYDAYEAARQAAVDGNANTNFIEYETTSYAGSL